MAANSTSFKTGNPGGGRPKADPEILAAFRELTPKAIEVIGRILSDPATRPSDRIRAAEIVIDRILGKPGQAIEMIQESAREIDISWMTPDECEVLSRLQYRTKTS